MKMLLRSLKLAVEGRVHVGGCAFVHTAHWEVSHTWTLKHLLQLCTGSLESSPIITFALVYMCMYISGEN